MFVPRAEFSLAAEFLAEYEDTQPEWGPLGYLVYKRTYANKLPDGTTEEFWQTAQRVVEGIYQIQKGHCQGQGLPWSDSKAQRSAQEAYQRMFAFKWLPPGRGLSKMGTEHVFKIGGACLNNCGFTSTKNIGNPDRVNAFSDPFTWLMDMSMLGVGVGFDTEGAGQVTLHKPTHSALHQIADSREGWVEYIEQFLQSYADSAVPLPEPDYSLIRPKGAPIRGFGGTASGPQSMQLLTERLTKLFNLYDGKKVDSRCIVDIANSIGECVVAGGVRRTAEISFGSPADAEFLALKDFEGNPDAKNWARWASNNSVIMDVDSDFSGTALLTSKNGEPGYLFLKNAQEFGRMIDPPNGLDHGAEGANPCITGDTMIFTDQGPRQAVDLLGTAFNVIVDGQAYPSTSKGVFRTGHKPVYLLKTREGLSVKVTGDHKILQASKLTRKKRYETWTPAQDLSPGDLIVMNNLRDISWEGVGTKNEGWLLGSLLGDGHLRPERANLQFWGEEKEVMRDVVLAAIPEESRRSDMTGSEVESRDMLTVGSTYVLGLAEKFGVTADKELSSKALLTTSSEFHEGFLRGLFDADGSVQGTQVKGVSVRLTSVTRQHLSIAQRMLSNLGVASTLYEDRREAGLRDLPGGSYQCHSCHELVVANDNLQVFADRVGFATPSKQRTLEGLLDGYSRTMNRERFVVSVENLTYLGEQDVYDCTIEELHAFGADGLVVHNCVEQTLWDHELCCLVETFPSNCDDFADYRRTLKFAYLYAKTVTMVPTHNERTNAVMLRNRRIGCSQSGIQDNISKIGLRKHLEWCDKGYKYIRELDEIYSNWLCIRTSIKMTSVKPSGSVSKLPGVREGIHEAKGEYEIQSIRINDTSPLLARLEEAGYLIEDAINEQNTKVVYFPMHYPGQRSTPTSMWEQLELAALMQAYWADNQVSVTIDFDPETEGPQIQRALEMYAHRLKGLSFMPRSNHGYVQAPKRVCDRAEYEEYKASLTAYSFEGLSTHEIDDKFCDGGLCEIPSLAPGVTTGVTAE